MSLSKCEHSWFDRLTTNGWENVIFVSRRVEAARSVVARRIAF
jgi:hypothetical protein